MESQTSPRLNKTTDKENLLPSVQTGKVKPTEQPSKKVTTTSSTTAPKLTKAAARQAEEIRYLCSLQVASSIASKDDDSSSQLMCPLIDCKRNFQSLKQVVDHMSSDHPEMKTFYETSCPLNGKMFLKAKQLRKNSRAVPSQEEVDTNFPLARQQTERQNIMAEKQRLKEKSEKRIRKAIDMKYLGSLRTATSLSSRIDDTRFSLLDCPLIDCHIGPFNSYDQTLGHMCKHHPEMITCYETSCMHNGHEFLRVKELRKHLRSHFAVGSLKAIDPSVHLQAKPQEVKPKEQRSNEVTTRSPKLTKARRKATDLKYLGSLRTAISISSKVDNSRDPLMCPFIDCYCETFVEPHQVVNHIIIEHPEMKTCYETSCPQHGVRFSGVKQLRKHIYVHCA